MAASDARFQSVQSGNSATFRRLRVEFNPGLNVFIGTYPTGRTHPFKPLCASAAVSSADTDFVAKVRLPLACGPTDGHRQKLRAGMRGLADRGPIEGLASHPDAPGGWRRWSPRHRRGDGPRALQSDV